MGGIPSRCSVQPPSSLYEFTKVQFINDRSSLDPHAREDMLMERATCLTNRECGRMGEMLTVHPYKDRTNLVSRTYRAHQACEPLRAATSSEETPQWHEGRSIDTFEA